MRLGGAIGSGLAEVSFAQAPFVMPILLVSAAWLWPRPSRLKTRSVLFVPGTPSLSDSTLFSTSGAVFGVLVVGWLAESVVVVALGLVLISASRRFANLTHHRREDLRLDSALITLADAIGQQLRSGGVLASSFSSLVVADPNLTKVFGTAADTAAAGGSLHRELRRAAERDNRDGVRLVAVALAVLIESGGPAVPALERLAQSLRDRRAGLDERRLQASQARASALVLGVLPAVFAVVAAAIEPAVRTFYLHTVAGAVCLFVMSSLVLACWLWIDLVTGTNR